MVLKNEEKKPYTSYSFMVELQSFKHNLNNPFLAARSHSQSVKYGSLVRGRMLYSKML